MIGAARDGGWDRVVAVFQPHRYTRTAQPVAGLRRRVRRRRRRRAHRRLRGGRGAAARRLGPARPARGARRAPRRRRSSTCRAAPTSWPTRCGSPAPATSSSPSAPATSPPCPTSGSRTHDRSSRVAAIWRPSSRSPCPGRVARDVPVADLSTYRVGGPVAVLVRVPDDAALARVAEVVARAPAAGARGRAGLEPARRRRRVRRARDRARRRVRSGSTIDDDDRRAGRRRGPAAGARPAHRGGGPGRARVLRRDPRLGRRCRADERGRPRVRDRATCSSRARVRDARHGPVHRASTPTRPRARLPHVDDRPDRRRRRRRVPRHARRLPTRASARIAEVVRWRREHQPGGANGGSVFRNPPGDSAGSPHRRLAAARACGSAARWCRRSTPTSSRPSPAPPRDDVPGPRRGRAGACARRDRGDARSPSSSWSASNRRRGASVSERPGVDGAATHDAAEAHEAAPGDGCRRSKSPHAGATSCIVARGARRRVVLLLARCRRCRRCSTSMRSRWSARAPPTTWPRSGARPASRSATRS